MPHKPETAESILNKVANEHSYEDWGEAMHDTHEHTQIEFAVQTMQEYSSLVLKECIKEMEELTNTSSGWDGYGIYCKAIEEAISILNKKMEENK
jgi:hypothetical protein